MTIERRLLQGAPHAYCVSMQTALDQPLFAKPPLRRDFCSLLALVQSVFDCSILCWRLTPTGYQLGLRLRPPPESEKELHRRWQLLGGRGFLASVHLRQRLGSLSGFMQTFSQRLSRLHHRRHGSRGQIWAGRFRSCLLADDAAIIATIACLEADDAGADGSAALRRGDHAGDHWPKLSSPPLRRLPGGILSPADEVRLGLPPAGRSEADALLQQFMREHRDFLPTYRTALRQSWAFGRPESLSESLVRLGRDSGRGRSRQIRELDDDFGLCGLWG